MLWLSAITVCRLTSAATERVLWYPRPAHLLLTMSNTILFTPSSNQKSISMNFPQFRGKKPAALKPNIRFAIEAALLKCSANS